MRKVKDQEECCRYREKLREEKLRKEAKLKKNDKDNVPNCCGPSKRSYDSCNETPLQSKPKCRKPKKEIIKCPANLEEAVPQIQPTFDEREKKINFPHILCVLEENEAKNLVKIMETRENSITNHCDQDDCENSKQASGTNCSKEIEECGKSFSGEKMVRWPCQDSIKNERKCVDSSESFHDNNNRSSICSFDSAIDLKAFALTKDEVRTIVKNCK